MKNLLLPFLLIPLSTFCQNSAPCENWYGSDTDRIAIQRAMFSGDAIDVITAINNAKSTRGNGVGCAQAFYNTMPSDNFEEPTMEDVLLVWNQIVLPEIQAFEIECPQVGRAFPSIALTAFYSSNGGFINELDPLFEIAKMVESQQYSANNKSGELQPTATGIYGYANLENDNPCLLTGVAGDATSEICGSAPELCIEYDNGLFSGITFGTSDHKIVGDTSELDSDDILGDIGGAGFDMGWSVNMMIEAALQTDDLQDQILFQNSAVLAGNWALNQPLVTNHNYTAKLIWFLANLYAITGEERFKAGVIDRLERNLLPGILMDQNNDGFVDGIENIPFEALATPAQTPGRMWDGHNALPWYHSMNAAALVETYVVFRDLGETEIANELKPYMLAMLDNLAYEINNIGLPSADGTGFTDMPFSLLLGIWKVSKHENLNKTNWENAVWAIWNHGVFESFSSRSINVPLYLLILSETPYTPWTERTPFKILETTIAAVEEPKIYPNPGKGYYEITAGKIIQKVIVFDMNGVKLFDLNPYDVVTRIDLSEQSSGTYIIHIISEGKVHKKLILHQR